MTITWQSVRSWQPGPLETAGNQLRGCEDGILRLSDTLDAKATPARWHGEAAIRAGVARSALGEHLEDLVTEVAAARRAVFDASDAVLGVQQAVTRATGFATANGLTIGDDGTVTDVAGPGMCYATQHDADLADAERRRLVQECAADVAQILRRARDVDADLSSLLAQILDGRIAAQDAADVRSADLAGDRLGALSVLEPPGGPNGKGTAADNAAWWATLSPEERDRVIAEHPEWIGNRDGVDFTSRDRANRILLPRYRSDLEARKAELEAERLRLGIQPDYSTDPRRAQIDGELKEIKDKLASLDTVEKIIAQPDRHLLALDMTHPRAQAAISVGDVDTADHVAVFTPGLTSTVQGMDGKDAAMYQLKRQAEADLVRHGETGTVATVTWLGYQAPQMSADSLLSGNSVALSNAARDGGRDLAEFYRGINATRTTDPDLTALGHSYGSTTTGYALREDTGVDRAAFFGSPGLSVDKASDLQVPTSSSYYGEAKWDPVGDLGRFGKDPSNMPGMNHLETGKATLADGTQLGGVTGHTDYLKDKSTSQYNLGVVVAGHPEDAVVGNDKGITDHLPW